MNPKVAVIMSVYKSDDLSSFIEAVDSILTQTYPVDLFVLRDGVVSEDIQSYLDNINGSQNVFVYSFSRNRGLPSALNHLIDVVIGKSYDFIARMDSDDISHANRIEAQVDYLIKNKHIDVLGTYCREFGSSFAIDEKKLPATHEEIIEFSITRCPLVHPTVMFRSSIFSNGLRYPINTKFTEDMALWFMLMEQGARFANLPMVLLDYRMTEETAQRRKGLSKALSEMKLRFKYMFLLKQKSFYNAFLILFRLVFHLLPASVLKFAYSHFR
ncbi:glycosyltransferase [Vibrio parahaemolyticus]